MSDTSPSEPVAGADRSPTPGANPVASALVTSGIADLLAQLDRELIGLAPVKTRIRDIAALLLVDKLRAERGYSTGAPSLHMSFTEILHKLGYLRKGHLVAVTRDDLVGQYIGHTAPKTKEILKKAMGGVLFIDEAYYLYRPENERDYGQEAIEILLQVMENNRDDLVVIFAGYKDRMDNFFSSNPGMNSRVAHHIDFPDYQPPELEQIAQLMLGTMQYKFDDKAKDVFGQYIEKRMAMPHFANARSVRNALDRARLRHASRLLTSTGAIGDDDLMTIVADDLLASRVFSTEPEAPSAAKPTAASDKGH